MTRLLTLLVLTSTFPLGCGDDDRPADAGPLDATVGDGSVDDGSIEDAGPPPPPPPADVAGTLRFVGCDPSPASVTVRLGPTALARIDEGTHPITATEPRPVSDAAGGETIEATVESTEEPGVLRFVAEEIPWNLYRLGVDVDDEGCRDLAWRGPEGGVVVAGDEAVTLEALALRTRLQVNAGSEADPRWVSAAWVEDPDAPLPLRVETDVEGVLAYDLQVSFDRFEVDALETSDFCDPPAGSPPAHRFETPPGGRELDLDVSDTFAPPEEGASDLEISRYGRLLRGAPVYLRVVPIGSDGPRCDLQEVGASSWVRLVLRPQVDVPTIEIPDVPPFHVVGTYEPGMYPVPEIISKDFRCHRVITDHALPGGGMFDGIGDPYGKGLVISGLYPPNGTAREGDRFCFAPPSGGGGSWYEDLAGSFGDLVGEIVDAVEWAVDRAAALYEQIKSAAVNLVANAIADLTGCEDICRAALELGMEIALTSMGMPPSLPDFDQLMDQGLDYVAAELAAQAGVPDFVAEQALDLAVEMAARAKATRGASYAPWLVRDTQARSSFFMLEVSRSVAGGSTTWGALWFRPMGDNDVWIPRFVGVHPRGVGEPPLRVPVTVEPELAGLPEVEALIPAAAWFPAYYGTAQRVEAWYQREWGRRLADTPCVGFELWGSISTQIPVPIEPIADVTISHDMAVDGFADPFEHQCSL